MIPFLAGDLRRSWRALVARPVLCATVVAAIGLVTAATTALFSVYDGLVARPLPYPSADATIHLEPASSRALANAELEALRDALRATPQLTHQTHVRFIDRDAFEIGGEALAEWRVRPAEVSTPFFDLFGAPAVGRAFTDRDAEAAGPRPVIISDALWRRRFGGNPALLGRTIDIPGTRNGVRWTLVGVMPRGFEFPAGTNVWTVARTASLRSALPVYARLTNGTSIERVRAAVPSLVVTSLRTHVRPRGAIALGLVAGAMLVLLVCVWTQTSMRLFSFTLDRRTDLGIRLALGASRGRVLGDYALRGAFIAAASLIVTLAVAPWLFAVMLRVLPESMTAGQWLAIDGRTRFVAVVLTAMAVPALVALPALALRRFDPASIMTRTATSGRQRDLTRALFVAQIALTTVILYVAGLTWSNVRRMDSADLGFAPVGLLSLPIPPFSFAPGLSVLERDASRLAQESAVAQALDRARQLPDVVGAAFGAPPLRPDALQTVPLRLPGGGRVTTLDARLNLVGAGYATVIGARVLAGRDLRDDDTAIATHLEEAQTVVACLVTRSLAQGIAPGQSAIGLPVAVYGTNGRIVGVIDDVVRRPDEDPAPTIFLLAPARGELLVRVRTGDVTRASSALLALGRDLWGPRAPRLVTHAAVEARMAMPDYHARRSMLGITALVAVPIAWFGIAGTLADTIRDRRRALAVRLALGATTGHVRRVLVQSLVGGTVAGVVFGLCAGILVGFITRAYVFGLTPFDLPLAAAVAVVMGGATWVSASTAAYRVRRSSLSDVLQQE